MSEQNSRRLLGTIADLRLCNAAQSEVIANLEEYQRTILGLASEDEDVPRGLNASYAPELNYLHSRRHALDSLIAAVERYRAVSIGLAGDREELAAAD
jgi:hypothetical protein